MATAVEYHTIADQQRRAAEECELGLVRDIHLASAERFTALANELARFATRPAASARPLYD